MSNRRVFLVQCLCPQRHAIIANPYEADAALDETGNRELINTSEDFLAQLIAIGVIDPWCSICKATQETWHFEVGRTNFETVKEAMPYLEEVEAANRRTAAMLKAGRN